MARHRLDLLPLLDVFMVVLFVFATIQEQRLDDTTRDRSQLEQRVAEVEEALRQTEARHREAEAKRRIEAVGTDQQRLAEQLELEREADHLRKELARVRQEVDEERARIRTELAAAGVPAEALDRIEVLTRVLDKYSVFEIEIFGRLDEEGRVRNDCCYRVDPIGNEWRSCGEIPARVEDREQWLSQGSGGLAEALRRTKGGNAMTLVRQSHGAQYRIASRLAEQLREQFSDQDIYAEEDEFLPDHCGG